MKLYIIEGPDNSGKSTLADGIREFYLSQGVSSDKILVDHFGVPEGKTNEDRAKAADESYIEYVKSIKLWKKHQTYDVVILDRAWYGEYVYGPKYRDRKPEEVSLMIRNVEDMLMATLPEDDVKLVITTVDNIGFLIKNEDGKSLSKAEPEAVFNEVQDFVRIAEEISALKHIEVLNVNIHNSSEHFVDKDELLKKALL